jgi:hypothetical protein
MGAAKVREMVGLARDGWPRRGMSSLAKEICGYVE